MADDRFLTDLHRRRAELSVRMQTLRRELDSIEAEDRGLAFAVDVYKRSLVEQEPSAPPVERVVFAPARLPPPPRPPSVGSAPSPDRRPARWANKPTPEQRIDAYVMLMMDSPDRVLTVGELAKEAGELLGSSIHRDTVRRDLTSDPLTFIDVGNGYRLTGGPTLVYPPTPASAEPG